MIRVKYDRVSVSVLGRGRGRLVLLLILAAAPQLAVCRSGRAALQRESAVVLVRAWRLARPDRPARVGQRCLECDDDSRAARRYPKHCAWLT